MHKLLLVRFSSIGDIVLTTPVIRCLREQLPDAELHFLTRESFRDVIINNPHLHRVWLTDGSMTDVNADLAKQNFTAIIDLHHNLRTLRLKSYLKVPAYSFNKLNMQKWLMVNFKKNILPPVHIVHRYLATVRHLKVMNDGKGLEYYLKLTDEEIVHQLPPDFKEGYVGVVTGAKHRTKIFPNEKLIRVLQQLNKPIVLLGGPEDRVRSEKITAAVNGNIFNACGLFSLNQSAALVKHAKVIVTNDTGLMHIAAAFQKPIVSFWGNTIPEFGMWPYMPQNPQLNVMHEIKNLYCRPCSKIGYPECPKGHFRCMNDLNENAITKSILNFFQYE
jgi:ADP-heptose:LPS heptosyltransferase